MDEIYSDTHVLSLPGGEALDWFRAVTAGERPTPSGFDWAGLAKGASLRARVADREESLAWAELCTGIYQRMQQDDPNATHDMGEMYCRVAMIEKYGAEPGDDVRDLDSVYRWFRSSMPTSYDETLRLKERLMEEITDDYVDQVVRPLQSVKQRLKIIRALPTDHELPEDVADFSRLYHSLP